ncbi:MAG: site-specific DNA-methyltransferase [Candidatus Solibacter sp.]|nr:site-specific DNA-methyltransferase [Candidatus Solibacter sp.]
MPTWKNQLYFGDNLKILREEIAAESVDLIYLDPPFNSNANYNVLFKEKTGEGSAAQVRAFDDTWHWTHESAAVYQDLVTAGPRKLADLLQAMLSFLGHNDVMAYLVMMAARLVEMHRVLKSTGSIYLHCDPTASHYLKLVMDAVFGVENYRNEITWKRTTAHSDAKQGRKAFGKVSDILFFYTKCGGLDRHTFNHMFLPYDKKYLKKYSSVDPDGRRYQLDNLTGPGGAAKGNPAYEVMGVTKHWRFSRERMAGLIAEGRVVQPSPGAVPRYKRYLDEMKGMPVQSVWDDIFPINSQAQERLGYPTQKPEALLERIIQTSSNEGDVVMDPFCGCGTAVAVAERSKRRWIGIDITYLAINLVQRRLRDNYRGDLTPYVVHGAPTDLANAIALKNLDPFQFEWWVVDLVNARPAKDRKRGSDSGVDGYIYFFDDQSGQAKKLIVQVKSGHVGVHQIRDLIGTMEREQAVIGAFLTLEEPTPPMKKEAAAAGFYQPPELPGRFPRIQIRTIAELLAGKKLEFPPYREVTFAKAERKSKSTQPSLFRSGSSGDD